MDRQALALSLPAIAWGAPWLHPWRTPGEGVASAVAGGQELPAALNGAGAPVRFVGASQLPRGMPYERYIFERGDCPTRENLHDFFNGLCWLRFPRTKQALNALQASEIQQRGLGAVRGPVRDAITVFDENGILLSAPPALWDALLRRDWRRLFIDLRGAWPEARLIVFGHALLEKLVRPRKGITGHVWRAPCPPGTPAEVDRWLAAQLTAERLYTKPFAPLPVFGIPGWAPENENFSFYDDSLVFRPAGRQITNTTEASATSHP